MNTSRYYARRDLGKIARAINTLTNAGMDTAGFLIGKFHNDTHYVTYQEISERCIVKKKKSGWKESRFLE